MKSKSKKIQILMKGIAIVLIMMFRITPMAFATSSLDDSNLEGSFLDKILYGTIGSTVKEIEEYFKEEGRTTLYISNEEQLRAFAEYVNQGNSCEGKEIVLLNDIELDTLQEWVPIGKEDAPFNGTFDGRGYTISGINFNRNNKLYSEITHVGLFGYIVNANIKNITIANSKFNIPYSDEDITEFNGDTFEVRYDSLGGIVGYNLSGLIENCHINSDVVISGIKYVGGIVGYNNAGIVINCTNNGIISGFQAVGGIAGANYGNEDAKIITNNTLDFSAEDIGKILNSTNGSSATIYAEALEAGGIVGASNQNAIIQKCVNNGNVKIPEMAISVIVKGERVAYTPQNVGGITGIASGTINGTTKKYTAIDGCINFGEVQGYQDVGGLVGQLGGLQGGYAILSNSIDYSTNIKAYLTTSGKKESGYLAGEITTSGYDDDELNTYDDSFAITYNNLYFAELEQGEVSKDMEHELAYGHINVEENYFYTGTTVIIKNDSGKNAIVTFNEEDALELVEMSKYEFTGNTYKPIATQTSSTNSITIENSTPIRVYIDSNYVYIYDSNIDGFNLNTNGEQIVDSSTGTTVRYEIYKNNNIVSENSYFKSGDIIKIKAIFNKYLTSSWGSSETLITAPTLTLLDENNNKIEITSGEVTGDKYTSTVVTYEYVVKEGDNINVTDLKLSKTGTIYAMTSSSEHPSFSGISLQTDILDLYLDTELPVINTKVYVENALETGRYTVGKEVLIEITTNEAIQGTYITPEIQISFSESGIGKYNYTKESETVGYAKCIDSRINVDGTTTWTYSYQIQERDEGNLQLEYKAGEITDLAGNTTNIKDLYTPQTPTSSNVSGGSWNNELGVTYEFYKNSVSEENRITSNTYLTKEDDLIVVATFDKVLYVHYGLSDGKNTNVRLTNTYNNRAPSLYLNGDSNLKNTTATVTTKDDSTVITYTFNTEAYDLSKLTSVDKLILKNENNTETVSTNGTTVTTNGLIPFATEWYDEYLTEQEDQYKTIASNAINTVTDIENIILDPVGVSDKIEQEDIYADTTSPTVEITIKDEDAIIDTITNKDMLTYEFKWSEEVSGFTKEDIKVTNGTVETFEGPDENNIYTATIKTTVSTGNMGNMEIVVEQDACRDLVGYSNVRTAKTITIDKQAPTVEIIADKDYVQVGEIITYTFNWSEAVKDFDETKITVNNAEKATEEVAQTNTDTTTPEGEEGEEAEEEKPKVKFTKVNDAQYTLEVMPTNGNDVEVIVADNQCTDIAGNYNIGSKHIIQVIPTLTISTDTTNPTNQAQITYTFTWSEEVIGFTAEDIIVNNQATKGELSAVTENENGTYSYTMTVDYENVIPNGNEGEVSIYVPEIAVTDVNGNGNAYTSNITRIDRIAPILISLEAFATSDIKVDGTVDSVKENYKVGDTVTVVATFSENIENTETVPSLALQFSDSGNAKGTVTEGVIEGNKITYTYTITNGDMGTLSVKGFSGKVIDSAGNETVVTKRALEGDTITADTVDPVLEGITVIAPDFEYDELLSDPGDTKRYGTTSKTRENNTITFITAYSEEIYYLNTDIVQAIDDTNKPTLTFKFGTGTERTATFSKVEGNQIYYTYNISSGDNGDLGNIKINGKVTDKAGNELTLTAASKTPDLYEDEVAEETKVDKITADTTKPTFTISATAEDKDDNGNKITGNGSYYRKGSIITITAKTNEYVYQNSNKNLEKFTIATAPQLKVSFETNGTGVGNCTNVEYKDNQTIFTYNYTIKENDNARLNLNIDELQGYDIALNGNNEKSQSVSSIYADTVNPVTNWQSWVESEAYGIVDNGNGTWTVTFSETLYVYNPTTHTVGSSLSNSNKASAPILLVSNDNITPLETTISSITTNSDNKTVITYTYSPYTKNIGAYGMKFANVSDKAGNLFNYKDQQAPTLSSIRVTSPDTGTYKAGEEITIVATFNEKVTGTAPTLTLKFGEESAKGTVSGGTIADNTITYTYTITDGDNGVLAIESFTGTGLTDLYDNQWVAPESVTLGGNRITADTTPPTVVITSNVETTNQDTVIYTFTWSENVYEFTADDIEVTNGSKGTFSGSGSVYTLEVDTTGEGRQIVKVNANVCTDIAGNPNKERATYNKVVIDYAKPEIRAKVNGGNYVIDTDKETSTLKETIVVNEELSKFEYIWSNSDTIPTEGYTEINPDEIQINSDIKLETQVEETGTYYMYIKVTDLAGNTSVGKTNGFIVNESEITLTPNTTETTKEDVTVTVEYGEGLTENRKAGVQGKTQSADSTTVIVSENGTVYAEATDIAGNKVYTTLEITNIDKTEPEEPDDPDTPPIEEDTTAPEITFNYTTTTATVGTPIGATITTNEDAIIAYSWDNQNWTSSNDYVRSQRAVRTPTQAGTYTLYARATDRSSNTSSISTLQFTIVESEEDIVKAEVIFEDLTTIQKDGIKYVKVSPTYTTTMLTAKMDSDALVGKTPIYENLTSDNGLKTGSEIKIDGETKYIIIVNGDVNCDGNVTFLDDIILINNYRIGVVTNLTDIQILAGDINNSGTIEFIPDIVAMNNYRLERINVL